MIKFEAGKTYSYTSICDSSSITELTITKRTDKSVWIDGSRFAVKPSYDNECEIVYPCGKYSMCPILRATKIVNKIETVEESEVIDFTEEVEYMLQDDASVLNNELTNESNDNNIKAMVDSLNPSKAFNERTNADREISRANWIEIHKNGLNKKIKNKITGETIEIKEKDHKQDKFLLIHTKDNLIVYHKLTTQIDAIMYLSAIRDEDEYNPNWKADSDQWSKDHPNATLAELIQCFVEAGK